MSPSSCFFLRFLCLFAAILLGLQPVVSLSNPQKPKENAEVLVAIKVAGVDVPTTGHLYFKMGEVGQPSVLDYDWFGSGTGVTTFKDAGPFLMKPNRHYQAILSAGIWQYGEVKFSAPAGYSIWIDDRPATTARVLGNPFLVAYKIELRADTDGMLPAGMAMAPRVGDLLWSISAGRYSNGLSAGAVQWRTSGLSAALLDPTSLNYLEPGSAEIAVTRHSDGALLELRTFQFLLYVRRNTTPGTGYDIEIYSPYAFTTDSGDGPYTYNESPYLTYRVSNPNGATWNNQIRIEKIQDTTETWTITQSGADWTVVETSSLRTITRVSTGSSPRIETVEVKDNGTPATVSTRLQRTYSMKPWDQEELTQEIANPTNENGTALTTTYEYHETSGTGGYGRLKSITSPDGSWVRYDYDDSNAGFGNLAAVLRPWLDSTGVIASNATSANCHATILSYAGERNVFNDLSAGAETKINDVTTAQNTVSYSFPGSAPNGEPVRTETITTYTTSTATLVSSRQIYNPTAASTNHLGRPRWEAAHDGTKTFVLRYKGQIQDFGDGGLWVKKSTPANNVVWGEYRFSGFNTAVQNAVAVTSFDGESMDSFYMVPNRSTVEIVIYDDQGRVKWTVPCIFTGASAGVPAFENYERESRSYNEGQLHVLGKLNGYQDIYWRVANGRLSGHTDNEGVYRAYGYDAIGRRVFESKDGIAASGDYPAHPAFYTHRALDTSDRVVSELVTPSISASPTPEAVTTTRAYNPAGQLRSETAESGAGNFTTTYDYTNGGRTVLATLPGATRTVDRQPLGTLVHGSAVVPQFTQTTANTGDGSLTTATYTLTSANLSAVQSALTANSPGSLTTALAGVARWTKVTTDWAGRVVREERPALDGTTATTFTKTHTYDDTAAAGAKTKGKLIKTEETGLAPTLFEYNDWRQLSRTGLKLSTGTALTNNSIDRITETDTIFEKDAGNAWWSKTTTLIYKHGSDATATASVVKTRLNKFTNNIQSQTVATDIFENITTRTVVVDRGFGNVNQLVTETIDHPDSSTDEVTVTRHGLLQKRQTKEGHVYRTYYDGRGRPIKTTDPRTDTSTTARLGYVSNSDRIAWRQDTAGNQTSYAYDSAGRLSVETDPLSKATRYEYNDRGQPLHTWGNGTYPVAYTYNDYGEQETMTTFQAGDPTTVWNQATWPASPPAGQTTTWAYDPATGTLTSKKDAADKTVSYTYTPRSQLKSRTWARGVTTTYTYSATTAEQTGIDYSDTTPDLTYTYNRLGQNLTVGDVTGTRTFNYSATTTQLTQEDLGSFVGTRSISHQYDSLGRVNYLGVGLTSSPGGEYNFTYGYDTYGRMNQVWTFTYAYQANSNLIASITDSASGYLQTRTYETNRDLLDVIETTWSTASKAKFDYASDTLGRRTGVAKTGEMFTRYSTAGLDTAWGYNDRSELTSELSKLGGTSTVLTGRNDAYSFDNLGNRATTAGTTHNGNAAGYTTNALNQYTQRTVPGVIDVAGLAPAAATVNVNASSAGVTRHNDYYFKGLGVANTSAAVWSSLTIDSTFGGSSLRTSFTALTAEPFGYDLDGNLTSDGRWDYTYDAENRLMSMQTHSNTAAFPIANADARRIEFKNDYLGRRVQKTVRAGYNGTSFTTTISDTVYLYSGWNLLREMNALNGLATVRGYVWGLDWSGRLQGAGGVGGLLHERDAATSTSMRPAYDGNGNLMALLNTTDGTFTAAYEYDAFGQTLAAYGSHAAGNPFRFSTKYTDVETGLVYYGLRYYSPTLGRFINRDPIAEQGGFNLYGFVGNNGVNRWDYLGMDPSRAPSTGELSSLINQAMAGANIGNQHPSFSQHSAGSEWRNYQGADFWVTAYNGGQTSNLIVDGMRRSSAEVRNAPSNPGSSGLGELFQRTVDLLTGKNVPKGTVTFGDLKVLDEDVSGPNSGRDQTTGATSTTTGTPTTGPLSDPSVRASMRKSWFESKPLDPNARHEEGGYYGKEKNGDLGTRRWPAGSGAAITPAPRTNGVYQGLTVEGEWHTHPNPPVDERGRVWTQGGHTGDWNGIKAENYSGDSFIISRTGVFRVSPTGQETFVAPLPDALRAWPP